MNDKQIRRTIDLDSKELAGISWIAIVLWMDIIFDGDDGSIALRLLIIVLANFIWFVRVNDEPITKARIISGAIMFDIGLISLYYLFDYKASIGLLISQIIYLILLAVFGVFNKKKTTNQL